MMKKQSIIIHSLILLFIIILNIFFFKAPNILVVGAFFLAFSYYSISFFIRRRSIGLDLDKFFIYAIGWHSVLLVTFFGVVVLLVSQLKQHDFAFILSFFICFFIYAIYESKQLISQS